MPVLDFIDAHQSAEFIGFMRFAFSNHHRVLLKEAQNFIRMTRLILKDPRLSLGDDFLGQRQIVTQLSFLFERRREHAGLHH